MGSMASALNLMEEAKVAGAPGIGFGEEGEGYLRPALVKNEHRICQALRQIGKFMPDRQAENKEEDRVLLKLPAA